MSHIFSTSTDAPPPGTKDGHGASDHDCPYEYHHDPRAHAPAPFQLREYARLLILRGRVQERLFGADESGEVRLPLRSPSRVTRSPSPWCRCVECGARAPLAPQLGQPMLCRSCEQTRAQRDVVDAILFTAGVHA